MMHFQNHPLQRLSWFLLWCYYATNIFFICFLDILGPKTSSLNVFDGESFSPVRMC